MKKREEMMRMRREVFMGIVVEIKGKLIFGKYWKSRRDVEFLINTGIFGFN